MLQLLLAAAASRHALYISLMFIHLVNYVAPVEQTAMPHLSLLHSATAVSVGKAKGG